jgi:2-polyprenyl-3-methyl-5-hydroxy-6-metoxy-1,4-benzoquinol methylase
MSADHNRAAPPATVRACWCGNAGLAPFSERYRVCRDCWTLVSAHVHQRDVSRLEDDETDLYGREYWFGHMERDLGFANIRDRARTDLVDRAPQWLRTVLTYKRPPAKLLELGSSHGGFVAVLRQAGFDAAGLELSPTIAAIARDLFAVDVLVGRLEDQSLGDGSLDAIVLMDVLEHLPDPVSTLRHGLRVLKPDGCFIVQTPEYPEETSLATLADRGHRFVEQLKHEEHLYLFSRRSITRLFHEAGCPFVSFEPAVFSHYDMCVVAGRSTVTPIARDEQDAALMATPPGRLLLSWLDAADRLQEMTAAYARADADRIARLELLERTGASLAAAEADRVARLELLERTGARLEAAEADRAARLDLLERTEARLAAAEADRALRLTLLEAAEADRAARLEALQRADAELKEAYRVIAELRGVPSQKGGGS